jgi:hypothetical protein
MSHHCNNATIAIDTTSQASGLLLLYNERSEKQQ